jgi:hypothetical protein
MAGRAAAVGIILVDQVFFSLPTSNGGFAESGGAVGLGHQRLSQCDNELPELLLPAERHHTTISYHLSNERTRC